MSKKIDIHLTRLSIAALFILFVLFLSAIKKPHYLTPDEFMVDVTMCEQQGKEPVPIYDKKDPIKVYRIDCIERVGGKGYIVE